MMCPGEYGDDGSVRATTNSSHREDRSATPEGNEDSENGGGNGTRSGTGGEASPGGGSGGTAAGRTHRWYELEDEDTDDSDLDWDDEDDTEDDSSPFFGRCALRSLVCRDDSSDSPSDGSEGGSSRGSRAVDCAGECGREGSGKGCSRCGEIVQGGIGGTDASPSGRHACPSSPRGKRSDPDLVSLPRVGRSKPPSKLTGEGLGILNFRRRFGMARDEGNGGSATTRDEESAGAGVARGARRVGGRHRNVLDNEAFELPRPGCQAML